MSEARRRLDKGESPAKIAREFKIGYMVIYKLAVGKTWQNGTKRHIPERKHGLTSKQRDKLYLIKVKRGVTNEKLARASGYSESHIAQQMRDAHALFAVRIQRALITSGDLAAVARAHGITSEVAERLVSYAVTNPVPKHLEAEIEE